MSVAQRIGLWHPYTQMKTAPRPLHIVGGKGAYLFSDEGKSYLDVTSSWWVNLHGHAHPHIADAICAQSHKLEHVLFPGCTHDPVVDLSTALLPILPGDATRLHFSDNGSTAVETALKISFKTWSNRGRKRTKIIKMKGAFHGETFGAMAVSGRHPFNEPYRSFLFPTLEIDPPFKGKEKESLQQLKTLLKEHRPAAFIYEPLILGAVGEMQTYSPNGLEALLSLCRQEGVHLIADEVLTGFGRTGPLFASEYMKTKPDLICLAKGLTGGFLPLAVTSCTEEIYASFLSDDREKAFLHGHSYCANPLGCVAAHANLELLMRAPCAARREAITSFWKALAKQIHGYRVEALGTIFAIELDTPPDHTFFLERKILIRPLGNVLYFIPPYCITDEELRYIGNALLTYLETQ